VAPAASSFRAIRFGFASAEKEGAEAPDLLLHGFLDERHVSEAALDSGSPFLFLGYKGSGKTALAEHARLVARQRPDLFVTTTTLDRFSYHDFKLVAGGAGDHQVRYPTAWGWLLLLALVRSLQDDERALRRAPAAYKGVVAAVETLGLMPVADLALLVATSSKQSFKASIPKFLEYTTERVMSGQDLQLYQLVSALQRAVLAFPTESRHVIFVDGLDSIVTQRELQFQSLAALMQEASDLNHLFRRNALPFKIVVLCRTDIFDRLPGANINKIRQDDSISLSWYDDPRDPEQTRLLRLVTLRAQQSLQRDVKLFTEFFPATIDNRDTRTVILDHTRHLPRDLIQVLRKIQKYGCDAPRLTPSDVKSGLRLYSTEYFLPEVRNELAGYIDSDDIDNALTLLTSMQRPRVRYVELERAAQEFGFTGLDLKSLIRALFDASCIGTVSDVPGRRPFYTFKYRNPSATILPGQDMRIHPGALKGLNIEPRRSPTKQDHERGRRSRRRRRNRGQQPPDPPGNLRK
jgi:hypothetical protein